MSPSLICLVAFGVCVMWPVSNRVFWAGECNTFLVVGFLLFALSRIFFDVFGKVCWVCGCWPASVCAVLGDVPSVDVF